MIPCTVHCVLYVHTVRCGSVLQALMEEFNVSGAFLLLGGFSLHFCFFAMFFRPTEYEGGTREIVIQVQEDPPAINAENPGVAGMTTYCSGLWWWIFTL